MEVRSHFHHIVKCGINSCCSLRYIKGDFVGAPDLLPTIYVVVHAVDLVENYPS